MTQGRASGSTLAEQIAAVKIEVVAMESCGYDDFAGSPEAKRFAAMRAVLATLEGMAAPGDERHLTRKEQDVMHRALRESARVVHASGDSPSPQQPTQEALELAFVILSCGAAQGELEEPIPPHVMKLALALDRVVAQRVTAAPVSGDAHDLGLSVAADWLANRVDTDDHRELASFVEKHAAPALTAATDKARREALAGVATARNILEEMIANGASIGFPFVGKAKRALAALTPQNPGEAEAQEG